MAGNQIAPSPTPGRVPPDYRLVYGRNGEGYTEETPSAQGADVREYLDALPPSLLGLQTAAGGGAGASSVLPPSVNYTAPTSAASSIMPPAATYRGADVTAADNAAFASAKDKAAQTAKASMTGLQQALGARGMGGAGYEAGQIGQTLGREANTIGEATRAQAINDVSVAQHTADENLTAGMTSRGQDLSAKESADALAASEAATAYGGQVTQRQQDIAANDAAAQRQATQAQLNAQRQLDILRSVLSARPTAGGLY